MKKGREGAALPAGARAAAHGEPAIPGDGTATSSPSLLYVRDLGDAGSILSLPDEEAHYLARVCRARVGDVTEATDGRGTRARLRIVTVGPGVRAEVVSVERAERRRRLRLWCGTPERGRADWLVEKLAELGVERFQPLECDGAPWPAGMARIGRWQRLAIAGLRQSCRRFLLEICPPISVEAAIAGIERPAACWVGDPAGSPAGAVAPGEGLEIGAIGPSSGFRAVDRERLEAAGFVPIRLADARLRTETAALGLAAWWAARGSGPGTAGEVGA